MKIAIIAEGFSESSLCLAKYLAETGICVDYYKVSGWKNSGKEQALEYDRVSKFFFYHKIVDLSILPELQSYYNNLPFTFHLIRHYSGRNILYNYASKKLKILFAKKRYDVINVIGGEGTSVFHEILKEEKIYHSVHEVGGHYKGDPSSIEIDSIILHKIPVHFFSHSTLERFLRLNGAERCIRAVIPFGKFETMLLYDKGVNINTGLDLSKPTFLFWGYLQPYKGLDVLLEAVNQLHNDSDRFNLIVAGRGHSDTLKYFNKMNNCFVMNKILTNQEINSLNKMATAVIMPYKSASQTGIAPTSFMYGLPIIATKVGALPDVIHHEINGLLVEPENPQKLAEAILRLTNNPDLLNKLKRGVKLYGNGDVYDWRNIAKQTIAFMNKVTDFYKFENTTIQSKSEMI